MVNPWANELLQHQKKGFLIYGVGVEIENNTWARGGLEFLL